MVIFDGIGREQDLSITFMRPKISMNLEYQMTQIYLAATSILIDLSYVCTMLKHLKAAQWIMYQFNTLVPEYIFMNEG